MRPEKGRFFSSAQAKRTQEEKTNQFFPEIHNVNKMMKTTMMSTANHHSSN